MTDFTKLFEQMMEQGQKMVRDINPEMEKFQAKGFEGMTPTLPKEMMDLFWGKSMNPGGLDAKTRLLAMLAGMTVQGAPVEPMFKTTVAHALESGATQQEIAEVITQMSVLGGLPAMTRALEFARAAFADNKGAKT
ncbi:MAG: carboxymuconolactone decarboxylase family protein [Paracoccaceae bacterium]